MHMLHLPLAKVAVGDRLRAVDPVQVGQLVLSMSEIGQITPIEVGPADGHGQHRLIAGAHRLEAAREVGLSSIAAVVFEGDDDRVRLHEIDENLYRHELTPYDQAAFLAERLEIFEKLNGKLKVGRPKNGNSVKQTEFPFFEEVAARFSLSRSTVERALKRRRRIVPELWLQLQGTDWSRKGADLDALARLTPIEQQKVLRVMQTAIPPVKSLRAAIAKALGARPPRGPDEFERLLALWKRSGSTARARFRDHLVETGALA